MEGLKARSEEQSDQSGRGWGACFLPSVKVVKFCFEILHAIFLHFGAY